MLLPWRDELHIALRPTDFVQVRRSFGMRGPRTEGFKAAVEPVAEAGAPAWRNALDSLAGRIPELGARPAKVRVVLSNHFVRFVVAPWRDDLTSREEREGYIRHCFRENFGAAADEWVIRENPEAWGRASLACAVDRELVDGLEAAFRGTRHRLEAVQPLYMAAFNEYRRTLGTTGCFLLHEKGRLCGGTYAGGEWRSVLAARTGPEAPNGSVIEREVLLHGVPEDTPVFLCIVDDSATTGTFTRPVKLLDNAGMGEQNFSLALLGGAG